MYSKNCFKIKISKFWKSDSHTQFLSKCAKHCKTKWMCCFDLDEFFVYDEKIRSKNSMTHFLDRYQNYDALYIKWRLVGHNGLENENNNKDIVKQYTNMTCDFKRVELPVKDHFNKNLYWSANVQTKWICKTSVIKNNMILLRNPHALIVKHNDVKLNIKKVDWKIARLNHYYILSKNELSAKNCLQIIFERKTCK